MAANLGEQVKARNIELEDMAIVERREDGTVKLHQTSLAGAGAVGGALWGGLIGLIFLMPLLGMALGAAAVRSVAPSEHGVDEDFMKRLGEELAPGKAALILLIAKMTPDRILPQIEIPGTVVQTSLSNESEEALRKALNAARA